MGCWYGLNQNSVLLGWFNMNNVLWSMGNKTSLKYKHPYVPSWDFFHLCVKSSQSWSSSEGWNNYLIQMMSTQEEVPKSPTCSLLLQRSIINSCKSSSSSTVFRGLVPEAAASVEFVPKFKQDELTKFDCSPTQTEHELGFDWHAKG